MNDGSNVAEDTFHKLRDNSPAGGWFPASQCLSWRITESNLAHTDLFFSPHLKKISVYAPQRWIGSEVPSNILATISSTISALPTSALQFLSVSIYCAVPLTHFTDSLSSVILRCGPSLMEFTSTVPLSDAAVDHLIQLPHLRTWRIEGPPPSYSASPLPPVFPPLTKLALGKDAVRGWLSLFQRSEDDVPTMQGVTPLSKTKESLESLDISSPSGLIINASFISSVQVFRNLVTLGVADPCRDENGEVRCTFKLNNGDITELAMALPRLEFLFLGRPCAENTCVTTVACLLPLSVYCIKLKKLQIHFNTTKIVGDLKNISEDPRLQELRSLPKCPLLHLYVNQTPLILDEPGLDTAVKGILDIFPSLVDCVGGDRVWDVLSGKIRMINWRTSVSAALHFPLA